MTRLPLEGIRVIDSSYVVAAPYAASILSDLGAEVIKIEGPAHTDILRRGGMAGSFLDNDPGDDPWNRTTLFNAVNRGKKSLTLDLSREEGRATLKDLIKVTDILMENFTPGVMRRWGMDYPNLRKIKPDIIMVSNTGYGHGEGPYAGYPAQANSMEATHGLTHITGYLGGTPVKAANSYYVDFVAFWTALLGIALALRHRNRTGKGQWLDIGMYQLGAYFTSEYILDWTANGRFKGRMGNRHPWRAPQGCYPCAEQDQWCVISVGDDEEWAALCRVMGKLELSDDPRFASGLSRIKHHDQIDEIIKGWTKSIDKFEVVAQLQGAGVPASPVYDARDTNLDQHLWERGFLEVVDVPEDRGVRKRMYMGRPWRLSKTPVSVKGPIAKLGSSNQEMLMDLLGYSGERYKELESTGIIGDRPNPTPQAPTFSIENEIRAGRLAYYDPDYKRKLGF